MPTLEAKRALLKSAIAYGVANITHDVDMQIKRRKDWRAKQAAEQAARQRDGGSSSNPDDNKHFDAYVRQIDETWAQEVIATKDSKLSRIRETVHDLNRQGPCSLHFFRHMRQVSPLACHALEPQAEFNQAFDVFDALHPEASTWMPTPKLMRTLGAVLAIALALLITQPLVALVAVLLLYCNKSDAPYFEPIVIGEAFPEDELENMITGHLSYT